MLFRSDQKFAENILEFLFCQIPEAAKRGGKGGPPWAHTTPRRGPPLLPRRGMVWPPWPTFGAPPSRTSSPRNPKTWRVIEEIFRRLHEAETTEREKALRQGEICRGNSFPEGGKSSPSSSSSSWTSLGSSSSSSPSSSPSSPPLHSVPL